ncbi:DnaJ-domain-containing protein [Hesseltinella vesiculosa]|uniref:DnaJ-domain-containing protein n=1 Tax=Hesseltinella vesiculosa TaxID=101127 RepID=A0A1X2GER5_9FUNG|nr:DnaJ-domain-containing protein [Hesseltinella vesiculosa]
MDPYSFNANGSIPDEDIQDYDDLERLEHELMPQPDDYYGLLNVSKTATEEEIKDSYKKLCRFFHPDKHHSEELRKIAEARFQVIQRAYEVLSDSQRRVIYDIYGEEGLQAKWEVGPKYKTPEELQAEYEKKARLKREKDLENLVRSKDEVQLALDVTQILDPYEPPVFNTFGQPGMTIKKSRFHRLTKGQLQQLYLRHTFESELGPQTRGIVSCSMVSRNGMGGGNLLGTIRHTFTPKMTAEATATLLRPRGLTVKTFYSMSSDSFCNTTVQAKTLYAPPILTLTTGRRLFKTTTGYVTYRTGDWHLGEWGLDVASQSMDKSSVALGLAGSTNKDRGNFSCELQTGIVASHLAADYTHKVDRQTRVRVAGSLSTMGGVTASVGSDHKLSTFIRLGMSMECGVPTGVTVKFKVSRLGQNLVIPIILSSEWDLRLTLLATAVPAGLAFMIDHLFINPKRQQQIQQKIRELREQHADILASRKAEALDAQKLIKAGAERKAAMEAKKQDGLVIVKALYGHLQSIDDESEEGVIDVTIVLQAMVNESRLTIPGGHSKTNICGFYDPCLGEAKKLLVQYQFQNQLHQVIVKDSSALIIPMRSHLV